MTRGGYSEDEAVLAVVLSIMAILAGWKLVEIGIWFHRHITITWTW